jgi:hypothetical protein
MKLLIAGLACVVLSGFARPGCITVTTTPVLVSSSVVIVTVRQDGKPVEGAVLEGFRQPKNYEAEFTLVTDATGTASTPTLSAGLYAISALTAQGEIGDLLLSVPNKAESGTTSLSIDLDKSMWNQSKRNPEAMKSIAEFRGTVGDAVGSTQPGGLIAVYSRDSVDKKPTAILHPDHEGQFSAKLKDGRYLVAFYAQDALPVVVLIRISGEGDKKPLAIKLGMRMC